MSQVNIARLHEDNGAALSLDWIAGQDGAGALQPEAASAATLIGHLNLTHPNAIQVLGAFEAELLGADAPARTAFAVRLFNASTLAVVLADGVAPTDEVRARARETRTPLFATPRGAAEVIEKLNRYLLKALAERIERHGVFMDVLGLGVLITGESGVGKSELGLELISRGHGLVADDVVEIAQIAANTLEGRCPAMLKDFIEVRGLGLLNMRTIFGETAVRPKMKLKLIAHLEKPSQSSQDAVGRLPLSELSEEILGVTIRKVVIPVVAGRNLAVLLEAAVRNYILQLRGIDSTAEFLQRQRQALKSGQ
ncbi:MAG TPA: HPr(Ser) kinase/phosphatase [Burkholderiales bacterium]|nr:HPr(Ser) kinase/phosphatase [Burkholderiales bacterium]